MDGLMNIKRAETTLTNIENNWIGIWALKSRTIKTIRMVRMLFLCVVAQL